MNAEQTGRFINAVRKEKNLTQQQLAEMLHVSDKAVSRWETGRGFPEISILEDIGRVLDVSVAELLKGERITEPVSSKEMREITDDSLDLFRKLAEQKKVRYLLLGFLFGAALLITLIVHLNSPILFPQADSVISIDVIGNDRLAATLKEDVAEYDISHFNEGEDGSLNVCTISCYRTLWNDWFRHKEEKIVILGNRKDIDLVYYDPWTEAENTILYNENGVKPYESFITLPRLIYNAWIVIGGISSVLGMTMYLLLKKKWYGDIVLKIAMIPLCFTLSLLIILFGKYDEVYNAQYYLSGIVLLAMCLYLIFLVVHDMKRKQKTNGNRIM